MHNSKTKFISTSSFSDESTQGKSERNSSAKIAEIFPYPEIWKKAFMLGQNVRFTRTPEVEILRRRIETDPVFAKQFKVFTKQERKNLTNIIHCNKKTTNSPSTKRVINSRSIENKASICHSTVLEQLSRQTVSTPLEEDAGKHKLQADNVMQKITPVFHLSDNAFFECEPFMLEQVNTKISEKDATSVNFASDKVASNTVSAFDESMTAPYRVLEYRFPQFYDSVISESPAEGSQGIEQISDLIHTKSDTIKEAQKCHSELVIEESAHTLSDDVRATIEAKNTNHIADCITEDVAKSSEDLSMMNAKGKTSQSPSASLGNYDSAFMPNVQSLDYGSYRFPPIDLLQEPVFHEGTMIPQETLERGAGLLESVLEDFGIKGEIIHVHPGPVVTMYEFEPAAGVKSSRVINLSDDIARSMSAISTRVAVIPGRNVIGIELPNAVRETVYLRELIQSNSFRESQFKLALALGKGINGKPVIAELAKMPHLLVAGTTGSGKSVAINTMILSILYRMTPKQCRLIMVDPKMLELSVYDGIPHLLTPVVTDPKKAVTALKWAVREMEERYRKMAKLGVRNIDGFNARVALAAQKGETIMCTVQSGFDKESGEMLYHEEAMDLTQLPYIVVIVDEMADLMMVAGKEIENAIQRLAQMARAAGIHLIMATQRPSVDVITGTIKANFPTRISFQVTSKIDSRTILGEQGAETLLGQGDMLHMVGGGRIVRVHGPFVSDEEIESVVAHLKVQGKPDYLATITDSEDDNKEVESADSVARIGATEGLSEDGEELYMQAVKIVMRDKKCSTSYIQRRLAIGYNKAASLVERMEEKGIVGAANHVGKREILLNVYNNNNQGDPDV
ncbi:DNA translocase FtsK [Bartonella quintana]|uniref:DNA translocase ftsK n=2 Tax=Bartonella quintana TaxID=803 RepID=W3TWD3_BARQI|nr:DNA translocase FtsK [Bartonella quintana]ETS13398.1 DNA translocase ftsK [Bartonella quintana BQ2-D70]ETS13944.1 DNA translocase ftsK [Bartonella quintana JK 73rel]ETS15631.1 DNA translocase ftsK [Bartonella quintana JK 73]ETS17635.1 DNA translocase ftsK [Bartonella quintana JK 7]ETS18464.1 DNA translocase ftsK [Bartonella quintana JK 12]